MRSPFSNYRRRIMFALEKNHEWERKKAKDWIHSHKGTLYTLFKTWVDINKAAEAIHEGEKKRND